MIPHVASLLFELEQDQESQVSQDPLAEAGLVRAAVEKTVLLAERAARSVEEVSPTHSMRLTVQQLTQGGQDDLVAAAQALGYSVRLRECVGGGAGAAALQNLRHSLLILSPNNTRSSSNSSQHQEEIIIDPTFKEMFVIAHPSVRYRAVLDALPPVFIGTPRSVQALVEHLCSEMGLAFASTGSVVPPWRSTRSMLTKWMPRRSLDLPLTPTASASAAPAGKAPPAPGSSATTAHPASAHMALPPCSSSTSAAVRPAGGCMNSNSSGSHRLLRQACTSAEAAVHGGSSINSSRSTASGGMHSGAATADSSNCSSNSSSAGAPHAALLRRAADGCSEGSGGSPSVLAAAAAAASAAAALTVATGNGTLLRFGATIPATAGPVAAPVDTLNTVANHSRQQAVATGGAGTATRQPAGCGGAGGAGGAGARGAMRCPAAVLQSAMCFEPLHRVVGGFVSGTTPI